MTTAIDRAIIQSTQRVPALLIFIYTPFCGTCKLAGNMIDILCATYPQLHVERVDIQTIPECRAQWQVQSVPCLIGFLHSKRVFTMYAFHSVTHLAEQIHAAFGHAGGD
jgi:thioredoxin 1